MSQNPYLNNNEGNNSNENNGSYQQPSNFQNQVGYQQQNAGPGADAKNMAVFAHLSSVIASILSLSTLSIIGPLIFWFIYKDKPGYEFTREASRRAFNFNFSLWVVSAACWVLTIITLFLLSFITMPVVFVVGVLMIIFHIIAAVAANRGEIYNYPMTFIEVLK